jgi:surfactin synthase thioesterase subunit
MIRADLEAMAGYQYRRSEPLHVPMTAVSLRHDLWSYPLRTDTWKAHTSAGCEVLEWEGDHYFPMRHPERILYVLKRAVDKVRAFEAERIHRTNASLEMTI